MKKYLVCVMAILMVMTFAAISAFAQGEESKTPSKGEQAQAPAAPQTQAVPAQAAPAAPVIAPQQAVPAKEEAQKPTELSIYGEVQAVNAGANSMTVQYYDYDNDEEKTTEIALDANSKIENAKAIGDIKKGDWVDVNYSSASGKNMAKMVSVEKEEPVQEETAPATE